MDNVFQQWAASVDVPRNEEDPMDSGETTLADVMASVAEEFHTTRELTDLLDAVTVAARDNVTGVDYASVSLTSAGGKIETAACTDEVARALDALQYRLGEGPCVDAMRTRQLTHSPDLAVDRRWPRFGPTARDAGARSLMGIVLFDEPDHIGALNLYSAQPNAFNEETAHIAAIFASHAAHALGRHLEHSQLTSALATRRTIGIAIGILMERYELNEHRAFQFLVRTSQTGNLKVRDIAAQIVEDHNAAHPTDPRT